MHKILLEKQGILMDNMVDDVIENIVHHIKYHYDGSPLIIDGSKLIGNNFSWFSNEFKVIIDKGDSDAYIDFDNLKFEQPDKKIPIYFAKEFVIHIGVPDGKLNYSNLYADLHHEFLHLYEFYNKYKNNKIAKFNNEYYNEIIDLKEIGTYYEKLLASVLYLSIPEETRACLNSYYEELIFNNLNTRLTDLNVYFYLFDKFNLFNFNKQDIRNLKEKFKRVVQYMFHINPDISEFEWLNELRKVLREKKKYIQYKADRVYALAQENIHKRPSHIK